MLVVCAHPDDESFGLGAVLRHFITDGAKVAMLCFTHGEASSLGGSDRPLSEIRSTELAGAATALGIGRIKLLDRPDGSLAEESLEDLADEVAAMVDEVRADLLLVFDEGGITGHPAPPKPPSQVRLPSQSSPGVCPVTSPTSSTPSSEPSSLAGMTTRLTSW